MLDVHSHYVAPELIETLAREGARWGISVREEDEGRRRAVLGDLPTGLPFLPPFSSLELRAGALEKAGVRRQLVSGWMDLAGYHLDPKAGAWLARVQNETIADLAGREPERYIGAAMVPLQDPSLAAEELRCAVWNLGMRAVQIGTNVGGRGLDEPELDQFWVAAQELNAAVVVHPAELGGPERLRRYFLHILVGNPSETTLAAGALLLGGVLERFPRLRVLLVHGGGFLPYQLGRLRRGFQAAPPAYKARATRSPEQFISSLYFDTILHDPGALRYLIETVGVSQVVVGTDYPFPIQDADPQTLLAQVDNLTPEDRQAIQTRNAERLLGLAS
jgi:aminocarboxymuconate-semialdehyde decarboxylase